MKMTGDLDTPESFRDGYDEAFAESRVPRSGYTDVMHALTRFHRPALRARIRLRVARSGASAAHSAAVMTRGTGSTRNGVASAPEPNVAPERATRRRMRARSAGR